MSAEVKARPRRTGRWVLMSVLLQLAGMAAIGLLVYPEAGNWFSSLHHNGEISGYVNRVAQTPSVDRQDILDAAYRYNETLQPGPLMDPYIEQDPDEGHRTEVYRAYEELLRVSGTDAIGTINYPRLNIALPIYHGTADEVISKGVGHLYGTSLPVGGPSTRAVLTAHSGLPHAKLFSPLHQAQVGDQFWISVLGEDHYYEVRKIETVLPGESDSMKIIENEDWVTLFTCTPIGVNSHRLLVHAQRIDTPEQDTRSSPIAGDGVKVGFPFWAVWFVGGSALLGWVLFAPPRRRRGQDKGPKKA